ncbi:hypothetical protein EBT25_03080 [bacterium]|nr:hypothetical protein [bacterium]
MTDNVIIFPKQIEKQQLQSLDEILERVEENRREHINYILDELAAFVFQRAHEEGFDMEQDDLYKDSILVVESIRSMLCKSVSIPHPLQKITEELISIEDEEVKGDGPSAA